jgi:4-amino-4-deoxy-L-arabinose transferase-like glycosyltransferase
MTKSNTPLLSLATFIAGVLLTLVGILLLRRGAVGPGIAIILFGVAAYWWSSSRLQAITGKKINFKNVRKSSPVIAFGLLSLASILGVFYLITDTQPTASKDYAADLLWLSSIVFFLLAAFWHQGIKPGKRKQLTKWWTAHRGEVLIISLIMLAAILARSIDLADHPYPWSGDEASVGLEARKILSGEKTDFFDTGWSGQPNWSFMPTAFTLQVIGDNITGVRAASALMGILAVLFVYLLGKEMFNKQVGLLAAAFLALYPVHVHFSRVGVNNINDSITVVLTLWLVIRATRSGRVGDYALAGVATGLTLYTYVGSRLVFIMAFGSLIYLAIIQRDFLRKNLTALLVYLGATVITIAPMVYFFTTHPDIFITRIGQEGILFNGWLARHAQETGQSVLAILVDQFSKSVLVFIGRGAYGMFYNSPQPYLTILASILFLLGMVYAFTKLRHYPNVILLGWFWAVILLGGMLTLNPPSNTRMVMTGPAVALFVAIGLWQLTEVLTHLNLAARWRSVLLAAMVLFFSWENGSFYFGEYRTNYYFQDPHGELAMEAGQQLRSLGPNCTLFLMGQPRVFTGFPTFAFIAPDNAKHDITLESLENYYPMIYQGLVFVAIPENEDALVQIAEWLPGGTWQAIPRKSTTDEALYYAYIIPPD